MAKNQQEKKLFPIRKLMMRPAAFSKKISVYKLMRLPLIYIDESGFAEDMPRIFWYASAGIRCFGKHDSMSKRKTNNICILTRERLLIVSMFDYSINADIFEA